MNAAASPILLEALAALAARVSPLRMDRVWLFPPREIGGREHGLAVLAVYAESPGDADLRRLFTLAYEAERVGGPVRRTDTLTETGSAPQDRLARIVGGVLRRAGAETEPPLVGRIEGSPERWAALLAGEAGVLLDDVCRE